MKYVIMFIAVATFVAMSARTEANVPARYSAARPISFVPTLWTEVGLASWYGHESEGRTASGEMYDLNQLTAAHRTLPFNSRIKVTNLRNGRAVTLRVNDRGPNVAACVLDVSKAAAAKLGFIKSGRTPVRVTVVHYPRGYIAEPASYPPTRLCEDRVK